MTLKAKNIWLIMLAFALLTLTACGEGTKSNSSTNNTVSGGSTTEAEDESKLVLLDSSQHPVVTMEMSNGGIVKIELYPEVAPNTVNNFISLVEKGFYDGLIFHRVIPGFMIQGGDPQGNGTGNPGYSIKGEFKKNKFSNNLLHVRGVISMARSQSYNSAGSQFFIMHGDAPHLDGEYAAFGEVIEGMEVVDEIANQPTGNANLPENPIYMEKVTVDLKGLTFEEPEIIQ